MNTQYVSPHLYPPQNILIPAHPGPLYSDFEGVQFCTAAEVSRQVGFLTPRRVSLRYGPEHQIRGAEPTISRLFV